MIKSKNLILGSSIILVCTGAFFLLLMNSSIPVFSVKELMDHPQSGSFINRNIQVVGVVQEYNSTGFYITDPLDVENNSLIMYINSTGAARPPGFEIDRTVLVEGKFLSMTDVWTLKARMISTKCPAKYKS